MMTHLLNFWIPISFLNGYSPYRLNCFEMKKMAFFPVKPDYMSWHTILGTWVSKVNTKAIK